VYESIRVFGKLPTQPHVSICLMFADKTLHSCDQPLDAHHARIISSTIKRPDVSGDSGEWTPIQCADGSVVGLLGLGNRKDLSADIIRSAFGKVLKRLLKLEVQDVLVSFPNELFASLNAKTVGIALGEGIGLANWKYLTFKKKKSEDAPIGELSLSLVSNIDPDDLIEATKKGVALAASANVARTLAATPPNVATTKYIAEYALQLAEACGNLKCKVIKGPALKKARFVGLEHVGKASENPPCMIELVYTPTSKFTKTIVLIGKTISYDTGGLSIKTREGMRGMKYDKCGGMAVLGAMHAISRMKPGVRVVGLLPTAENSISNNALRVDDILQYPNGVSVEVTNTDAEGRLVLADALIYGSKEFAPSAVIDVATLTGGVVVGLGKTFAGYWCADAVLREQIEHSSSVTGERVWRLPMHDDYREMMKAKQADLWNSAPTRDAHPIQGAAFLCNFIDSKIPWAHIDIAGVADIDHDKAPFCSGPTGFGTRLLTHIVEQWK